MVPANMLLKVAEAYLAARSFIAKAKKAGPQRNEQQRSGLSQIYRPRFDPDIRRGSEFQVGAPQ